MNPLNPWVAVTEMLFLLGIAFLLGRTVAWLQYRKRTQAQQRIILQLEGELNRNNQVEPD